jgi:hypothetical protein
LWLNLPQRKISETPLIETAADLPPHSAHRFVVI